MHNCFKKRTPQVDIQPLPTLPSNQLEMVDGTWHVDLLDAKRSRASFAVKKSDPASFSTVSTSDYGFGFDNWPFHYIVAIGSKSKVFGLSDAPVTVKLDPKQPDQLHLSFDVDSSLLQQMPPHVEIQPFAAPPATRLEMDESTWKVEPLDEQTSRVSFSVRKANLASFFRCRNERLWLQRR